MEKAKELASSIILLKIQVQLKYFPLILKSVNLRMANPRHKFGWRIIMIRCHLARMMGEHKMRIADVVRETGLSRNTITLLYKETAQKIDLIALDKLCVLFNCKTGDLLEQVN
tara:strand:+ start:534 stop:872 length:339 start_codon:yes stop_codon:yes gene_type:complete